MSSRTCIALIGLACALGILAPGTALAENLTPSAIAPWEAPGSNAERLTHAERPVWQSALDGRVVEVPTNCGTCGCRPVCDPCNGGCGPNKWQFEFTLGGWLTGMEGSMTIGGRRFDLSTTPGDLFDLIDKLEFMISGNFVARYGRWSFSAGGMFINVGEAITLNEAGAQANASIDIGMWQANVGYCLGRTAIRNCCGGCSSLKYEVYVGARGYHQGGTVTTPLPSLSASDSWVDPVVGGQLTWFLGRKWEIQLQADVGGFGAGSDLSYLLKLGATYNFNNCWDLRFGMNLLDVDYQSGNFAWDLTFWGPYIGVTYSF